MKVRRVMFLCLIVVISIFFMQQDILAENENLKEISVSINGQDLETDTKAIFTEDNFYVPLRAVAENLGYNVSWQEKEGCAVLSKSDISIYLYTKNRVLLVNEQENKIHNTFVIRNNRILVNKNLFQLIFNQAIAIYKIGMGDSYYQIAMNFYGPFYPIDYGIIMEANGISDATDIDLGQVVVIPNKETLLYDIKLDDVKNIVFITSRESLK